MNFFKDKKNLAFILFSVSVFLIILNIIINKLYPENPSPAELQEISSRDAGARFVNAIKNYGFEEEWIVTKKIPDDPDEPYSFIIRVPKDVPIALLIKEITGSYSPQEAEIIVEEKKINGNNNLRLYSNNNLKLTSEFVYTADITRKSGLAGTLILEPQKLSDDDLNAVIGSPQLFGVVLVPSKASVRLSKRLLEERKEIVILLNDDINELEYKLGPGFSQNRIKDVIRTIIGSYPRAAFYLIDAGSSIYNSAVRELIINEFEKRKIVILPTDLLLTYDGNIEKGLTEVVSRINEERKLIAIPAAHYLSLNSEFDRLRKIGFKFVNPSTVIN